jgi:hypothetical protein
MWVHLTRGESLILSGTEKEAHAELELGLPLFKSNRGEASDNVLVHETQ